MRQQNTDALRNDKETAIFDAACRVIREKGYHQARMADIANEAGISYGLVYHYYGSKADLFDALMNTWWVGLDELFDDLVREQIPLVEGLGRITRYFFDQYEAKPDLVHIFITEFSRASANLTPERLARFKGLLSRTQRLIAAGQAAGAVRSDLRARYLTFFFLGCLEALLSTMVLDNQPLTQDLKKRLIHAVMTMFFEGARPGSSPP